MSAVLLVVLLLAGESRWWTVQVEVTGPLEELRLDAGSAGSTRVRLGLGAGERRRLEVPVPALVPFGLEGLASVPLPTPAAPATLDRLDWSAEQPAARLGSLPRGLLARPRPPAGAGAPEAPPSAAPALLLAAGWVLVLGLRRRPRASLLAGLGVGAVLAIVAARSAPALGGLRLFEGDLASGRWLRIDAGAGELIGRFDAVEVEPAGTALELFVAEADAGPIEVRAARPAASLHGLAVLPPGAPGDSAFTGDWPVARLERVWTRAPAGPAEPWVARGAWSAGEPLPPALPEQGGAPPGWLLSGLPAGTGLLLGRVAGEEGGWLRATGFDPGG